MTLIRLNHPRMAAMRPYVKLLWPLVIIITKFHISRLVPNYTADDRGMSVKTTSLKHRSHPWSLNCQLYHLYHVSSLLLLPAALCHFWHQSINYKFIQCCTSRPNKRCFVVITRHYSPYTRYSSRKAVMACLHHRMVWIHTQSHVSRICQRGFPLPSPRFSSSWVSFSYGKSFLTAEAFLWPHPGGPGERAIKRLWWWY